MPNAARLLLAACMTLAAPAHAAEDDVVGSLTEAETKKAARFGRDIGHTLQCADQDARREMVEDMRLVFHFISQDMGTDAAFVYAAMLGVGAAESNEGVDCAMLAEDWKGIRESFGLAGEDG